MFIPVQENTGSLLRTIKTVLDRKFTSNNVKNKGCTCTWVVAGCYSNLLTFVANTELGYIPIIKRGYSTSWVVVVEYKLF